MTIIDWAVIAAGVAAIGWVQWYFFAAEAAKPALSGEMTNHDHGSAS
jgi:hypothetical protein